MSNLTIWCHILHPRAYFTNSVCDDFILGLGYIWKKLNAVELSHPPYYKLQPTKGGMVEMNLHLNNLH